MKNIQMYLPTAFMTFFLFLCAGAQVRISQPVGSISPRTGLILKDDVVLQLIQTSSGDLAHDYVSKLALWNRDQASEGYSHAAEWILQKAGEFGLRQVRIERFPCDGKIEYFGQVMDPQWKVRKAELFLTSPYQLRLTSYEELPMSVAEGSTSTDIEAELADIGSGTSDDDYAAGVRGKIVLTTSHPSEIYDRAVLIEGAAGIISSWSVPDFDFLNRREGDYPDQVGWGRIPLEGSGRKNHFAFLISSRHAGDLKALIARGKTLRIHAQVDAEIIPGNLEVVSGIIPGSKYQNEEIIVTAHLDHYKPGANDNASGSAVILEMAKTLNYLIETKVLPQPLRTIRFMWVPEYNGTYAWLSAHINDPVKMIANLNFDMVGENIIKTNSILSLSYTSDSNPSFLNALMESTVLFVNKFNSERYPMRPDFYIGSITGSRNRVECRMEQYTTGTDHELFNNLKIGAVSLGCWPDNFYHSSEDTPDKVDPTQLHRAITIGLAGITTIGYSDSEQAKYLAQQTLLYGRKRISESEFKAIRSVLVATNENFNDAERLATGLLTHVYTRELAAIESLGVFSHTSESKKEIEKVSDQLRSDMPSSLKKVEKAADSKSNELRVTRIKSSFTDQERQAAKLVPVRMKGMELHNFSYVVRIREKDPSSQILKILAFMEKVAKSMREEGVGELVLYGLNDVPAFYVDGKRSILEIRDAVAAEYVPVPLEILELYFRAFEQAGVMKITEK